MKESVFCTTAVTLYKNCGTQRDSCYVTHILNADSMNFVNKIKH